MAVYPLGLAIRFSAHPSSLTDILYFYQNQVRNMG